MLKHSAHSEGLSMLLATYIQLQAHCWCDSFGYFSTRPKRSFWLHCDVQTSLFRAMALPLFLLIASSMRVTSTAKACALVQMLISMFVRLFTDARSVLLVLLVSLLFRTSVPISTANSFHVSSRSSCPAFLHPTYISCLLLNCWPMLLVCLNVHATTWPSLFIYPLICFQFPFLTCNRLLLSVLTVVLFLTNLSPLPFCHIGANLIHQNSFDFSPSSLTFEKTHTSVHEYAPNCSMHQKISNMVIFPKFSAHWSFDEIPPLFMAPEQFPVDPSCLCNSRLQQSASHNSVSRYTDTKSSSCASYHPCFMRLVVCVWLLFDSPLCTLHSLTHLLLHPPDLPLHLLCGSVRR